MRHLLQRLLLMFFLTMSNSVSHYRLLVSVSLLFSLKCCLAYRWKLFHPSNLTEDDRTNQFPQRRYLSEICQLKKKCSTYFVCRFYVLRQNHKSKHFVGEHLVSGYKYVFSVIALPLLLSGPRRCVQD